MIIYLLIIISVLLFLLLLHLILDSRRKHKNLIMEAGRVVKNYEQILTVTAYGTYKGIRRVDLESSSADYIYFDNDKVKHTETGEWNSWLNTQKKNIHPDDCEKVMKRLSIDSLRSLEVGKTYKENYRSANKNSYGYYNTYSTTISVVYVEGRKTAILTTIDNTEAVINEIKQKQLLVSAASIYISMHVLDIKDDTLITLNSAEHISEIVNDRTKNVFEILKDTMSSLTDEQYLEEMLEFINYDTLDERMKGLKTITMEFLGKKSGWCRARFIVVDYDENNRLSRLLWVVENIDAEKKKANHLLYLSETDIMTGIRNRGSGEKKIRELMDLNHDGMFCLLDVDDFKWVNDNLGHDVGDKVLIEVANCLKESFRESDIVMRLGGDEFAVFADGVTDQELAISLINRFFDKITNINISELGDYDISVSMGVAFNLAVNNQSFEKIYKNADSCVYDSKKKEGNVYTFY